MTDEQEWTIEEVPRAGTTVIIFYKNIKQESGESYQDARGSIVCNDEQELERWRTVLTILNSTPE